MYNNIYNTHICIYITQLYNLSLYFTMTLYTICLIKVINHCNTSHIFSSVSCAIFISVTLSIFISIFVLIFMVKTNSMLIN